jgi:hypothetical protein
MSRSSPFAPTGSRSSAIATLVALAAAMPAAEADPPADPQSVPKPELGGWDLHGNATVALATICEAAAAVQAAAAPFQVTNPGIQPEHLAAPPVISADG